MLLYKFSVSYLNQMHRFIAIDTVLGILLCFVSSALILSIFPWPYLCVESNESNKDKQRAPHYHSHC